MRGGMDCRVQQSERIPPSGNAVSICPASTGDSCTGTWGEADSTYRFLLVQVQWHLGLRHIRQSAEAWPGLRFPGFSRTHLTGWRLPAPSADRATLTCPFCFMISDG